MWCHLATMALRGLRPCFQKQSLVHLYQNKPLMRDRLSFNPLRASCSCDARIGGCRQNGLPGTGLLIPHSPFSQHPPIKRHLFATVNPYYSISKVKLILSLLNICKIHYKMVCKVAHGNERVNRIKYVNPVSAMGDFRHHIIVYFTYLKVKELT